jgi:hypothetical protein
MVEKYDTPVTVYPTFEDVEKATSIQLTRWNRFLPSPKDQEEVRIITEIVKALGQLAPSTRAKASKRVGWGRFD